MSAALGEVISTEALQYTERIAFELLLTAENVFLVASALRNTTYSTHTELLNKQGFICAGSLGLVTSNAVTAPI